MPVQAIHQSSYYTAKQAGFVPTSWCMIENSIDRISGIVGSLEDSV
jgi:hypothetical protein